jgi:amino acid permease
MLGTSMMAMPWAMKEAGLATGIVCCLLVGFLSCFTACLIDKLHKKCSRRK